MNSVSSMEDRQFPDRDSRMQYSMSGNEPNRQDDQPLKQNYARHFFDTFKRDPNSYAISLGTIDGVFDPHAAAAGTATSPLARKLKCRHVQMIAIGSSIGWGSTSSSFLLHVANICPRYGSFCCLWQGSEYGRARVAPHCFRPHWDYVILYDAGPRRNGCLVPCRRILLSILYAIFGPCLGFCYGLEVGLITIHVHCFRS